MATQTVSAHQAGTVTLGGELTVNRLGYGAMRITGEGVWGPPRDRAAALAVLRRAVELGVNFIDTADSYGPGVSEELIAEALAPYPAGLVIATKGGWNRPGPGQWTHDASPAHLRKAVEGSLKRLRVERIDVYQLHTPDPATSFDRSIETLAEGIEHSTDLSVLRDERCGAGQGFLFARPLDSEACERFLRDSAAEQLAEEAADADPISPR